MSILANPQKTSPPAAIPLPFPAIFQLKWANMTNTLGAIHAATFPTIKWTSLSHIKTA